jgi:hypothetical protein
MSKIASPLWNLNDVVKFIEDTGRANVETDNYGNIVVYPALHEDAEGNLCEGNLSEEDLDENKSPY